MTSKIFPYSTAFRTITTIVVATGITAAAGTAAAETAVSPVAATTTVTAAPVPSSAGSSDSGAALNGTALQGIIYWVSVIGLYAGSGIGKVTGLSSCTPGGVDTPSLCLTPTMS